MTQITLPQAVVAVSQFKNYVHNEATMPWQVDSVGNELTARERFESTEMLLWAYDRMAELIGDPEAHDEWTTGCIKLLLADADKVFNDALLLITSNHGVGWSPIEPSVVLAMQPTRPE